MSRLEQEWGDVIKTGYRSELFMPRSSYLPAEVRDKTPLTPEGTDLAIWSWESDLKGKPGYLAIAFAAKQNKPLWYHFFQTAERREKEIQETIDGRKKTLAMKQKIEDERKQFVHDLKVGDILYSSWGYDQTNISWFQVTRVIGKAIEIREIEGKIIGGFDSPSEKVMPVPNHFVGAPMRKIPQRGGVHLNSYSSAYKWDGLPKYETGAGWGH